MRKSGGRHARLARLLGACVLLGVGMPVLMAAGSAEAAVCAGAVAAGTSCTVTGTLTLSAGTLTFTPPTALTWGATVSGLDQLLVDGVAAHQSYIVNDATGSGAGWHVGVSATTFTTGPLSLGNTGTFSTTGSLTSAVAATAPTAACSATATCTLPTDTTTYPVAITTAASSPTSFTVYDTSAATGLGSITIGIGANPVGWWINVPANTKAGVYTSTVTLLLTSAP